jgi:aryl-alcohol dehydrogenase-like predicted oxidoreductase
MQYRFLGPTGIRVSIISYGNWVNSNSKEAQQLTNDCVKTAWEQGINFFDTAEVYGRVEIIQDMERQRPRSEKLYIYSMCRDISLCSVPNYIGVKIKISLTLVVFLENTSLKD